MDTIFRSKIDPAFKYLFYFAIVLSAIVGLYLFYDGVMQTDLAHRIHRWLFGVMCLTVGVYLPWTMLSDTQYYLDGEWFIAKCGPFKQRVLIKTIQSVVKSRNLWAGPALSQERLIIYHGGNRQQLIVSPDHRDQFIVWLSEHPNATFLDDSDYT